MHSLLRLDTSQWSKVVATDLRKLAGEPFFIFIMLAPLLLAIVLRLALPALATSFENFDLVNYYPLIIALFILTPPLYYGIVLALLVLDEKDCKVLLAVAVTPISLRQYLFARISLYTLVSIPLIVIVHEIIDVIDIPLWQLILVALACGLNTPLLVTLLAAVAKNQMQAIVFGRGLGAIILLPLAMFFVPDYWHLLCGVMPTYWPIISYFTAASESGSLAFFLLAIAMSLVVQILASAYFYRQFEKGLARG